MTKSTKSATGGSQTLSRGLTALALIGESETPLTVPDIAERLGIHRSMAYRLMRTFEEHGFAYRTASGHVELGTRLAALTRNVARDLQRAAMPELIQVANDLDATTFLVAYDGEEAVTIASAEPQFSDATVGQRPGTRHPVDKAAPGRVIRSQLDPETYPQKPYETSHNEVVPGLSSIAVPLHRPDGTPGAVAALFLFNQDIDVEAVAQKLTATAARIANRLG